jgi:hypothetical protein
MKVHMQVAITIEQLLDLNTMNLLDDLKLWRGGDAGVWQLDQGGGSHLLLTEEDLLARYKSRKDTGKKKKTPSQRSSCISQRRTPTKNLRFSEGRPGGTQ